MRPLLLDRWEMLRLDEELNAKIASIVQPALAAAGMLGGGSLISGTLDARQRGEGWGESLRQGVRSGLTHGALGAVGGAALGAAAKKLPALQGTAEGVTNYGRKALHAVTGYGGIKGLRAAGGGSAQTQKWLDDAQQAFLHHTPNPAATAAQNSKELLGLASAADRARKAHQAVQAAEEAGLTHLPGLAKGLMTRPVDTTKKVWNASVRGLSGAEKALFGLGTGLGLYGSVQDPDPDHPRSLASKAISATGNLAGNVLTAPLQLAMTSKGVIGGLAGQMAVGGALNRAVGHGFTELAQKVDENNAPAPAASRYYAGYSPHHGLGDHRCPTSLSLRVQVPGLAVPEAVSSAARARG